MMSSPKVAKNLGHHRLLIAYVLYISVQLRTERTKQVSKRQEEGGGDSSVGHSGRNKEQQQTRTIRIREKCSTSSRGKKQRNFGRKMMSPRLLLLPRQVATRLQQQVLSCARPQSTSSETSSSSVDDQQQELRVPPSQMPNMMDIGSRRIFNEEHDIFRESVRKFAREVLKPQQPAFEAAGMPTRKVWEEMGAQGLLGVGLPEEEGGSGGTFKHEAICIEEACYAQVRNSTC